MRPLAVKILFLAYTITTQVLHIRSSPPRFLTNDCPSIQEVSSTTFIVDEYEISHQTFTCIDANFTAAAMSSGTFSRTPQKRTSIEERSAAECTTPNPVCQCGAATDCGCFNNGPAPSASDCSTLIGSTAVLSSLGGPTFIVPPNTFMAITLNTCSLGFINLATTNAEYCWDDLAAAGNDVVTCISELDITSGLCVADDERFFTRLGPVD
ncbi:hypothetical protein ACEPAF_1411 [Sanghuangporus sanghuang]